MELMSRQVQAPPASLGPPSPTFTPASSNGPTVVVFGTYFSGPPTVAADARGSVKHSSICVAEGCPAAGGLVWLKKYDAMIGSASSFTTTACTAERIPTCPPRVV